ncbi:MAG: hypothetical protein OHK0013_30980 [Sandaracinaceae bacterium]
MPELDTLPSWMTPLLAVLAGLFVLLVIVQAVLPSLRPASGKRAARARLSAAVARGSDTTAPAATRALAFVEAGREALGTLKRPGLAARYARYAHDLAPADAEVVSFAIEAMTAARRHVGLERLLWVTLDRTDDDACFDRALAALRRLYEGPLARPERARVLTGLTRASRASAKG